MTNSSSPLFTLTPTKFNYTFVPSICFAVAILGLYAISAIKWDWQGFVLSILACGGGGIAYLYIISEKAFLTPDAIHYTRGFFMPFTIDIPLSAVISAEYFSSWYERPFQAIAVQTKGEEKKIPISVVHFDQRKVQDFIAEINRRIAQNNKFQKHHR